MGSRFSYRSAFLTLAAAAAASQAAVLQHVSVAVSGTGGSGGAGTSASDMVYQVRNPTDGWGWAGGAGSVQGNAAVTNTGGASAAANEVLSFNIGATIDSLNAQYGAGNWSVQNATLSLASSYAKQNNSRFGVGSGTFNIYWVGNDNWAQSAGTTTDRQLNPPYASDATTLQTWAGSQALLGAETFTVPSGGGSYVNLSWDLAADSTFLSDITSATAASNPALSLYLMGTSDTLGMIIFTGGQGQITPTLSFDVVPEPASIASLAVLSIAALRRRRAE